MAWVGAAANAVKTNRQALDADHPLRKREQAGADMLSAGLDAYRAVRDAVTEATFFNLYANLQWAIPQDKASPAGPPKVTEPRELPEVKAALASIEQGGYAEALARVACLLKQQGEPLPLSRLELRKELVTDYAELLPELLPEAWRRIRGQQELITLYAPERALETLPVLLHDPNDRQRLQTLIEKLREDERLLSRVPTAEQAAMLERIRAALSLKSGRPRRPPLVRAS